MNARLAALQHARHIVELDWGLQIADEESDAHHRTAWGSVCWEDCVATTHLDKGSISNRAQVASHLHCIGGRLMLLHQVVHLHWIECAVI